MVFFQRACLTMRSILAHTIMYCTWLLHLLVTGIFTIYRIILGLILRLKYGDKYGGLFDTSDSVFLINNKGKSTILSVLIAKFDGEKDIYTFMEEQTRTKVFSDPRVYPKLTSTHRMFGGYPFWVKNDYKLHECLKTLPIPDDREFDEEYLKLVVSDFYDTSYPKNGSALWDIHVSPKYLKNYKNDGFYYYPLVLRLNHAICDGTSFFDFLVQWLASNNAYTYSPKVFENRSCKASKERRRKKSETRIMVTMRKIVNLTSLVLYVTFIGMMNVFKATYFRNKDQNSLHGPKLTGKKIIAWRESPEYIPMVKKMRHRVPGTKFSSILETAVSASFTEYFEKNGQPAPDKFSTVMAELLHLPETDKSKPISLENKTTYVAYNFPTNKNSLVEILEKITVYKEKLSYGDKIAFGLSNMLAGICPLPLSSVLVGLLDTTNIFTNVPGCEKICLNNGGVLDSLLAFAPNIKDTGITLSMISYDDKLQIGILVDKAIISSRLEAQTLVDNIFHYIKCLDIETRAIYGD